MPGGTTRTRADSQIAFERNLVVELERPGFDRLGDAQPEVERDGLLDPAVRDPAISGLLGDAQFARIQRGQRALDRAARGTVFDRPRAAVRRGDGVAPALDRQFVAHTRTCSSRVIASRQSSGVGTSAQRT